MLTNKIKLLESLFENINLDFILIYSNEFDYRYEYWLNSTKPLYFHYLCIDKGLNLFYLEHSYLIDDLKKYINPDTKIFQINESTVSKNIKEIIGINKKIGILGNAPIEHLKEIYQNTEIHFLNQLIDPYLNIKTDQEIKIITQIAKDITQIAQQIPNLINKSTNLIELRDLIKKEIFSQSADALSFPISIANDEFLKQSTVKIPDKDLINKNNYALCIDMGLKKHGFYTDITRMFFSPNHFLQGLYEKLKQAHYNVIKQIRVGSTLKEIVNLYYQELQNINLSGKLEVQDLGHSIGFGLHEEPFICNPKTEEFALKPNMIITLEPEIILDNQYRIRIEDMLLITNTKAKILTK